VFIESEYETTSDHCPEPDESNPVAPRYIGHIIIIVVLQVFFSRCPTLKSSSIKIKHFLLLPFQKLGKEQLGRN
jgi:hypothetical protein